MAASLVRVGSSSASASLGDGATIGMERIGGVVSLGARIGGCDGMMSKVCSTSITVAYLEIAPTIVWVVSCEAYNDVYSNRNWQVE